MNEKDLINTFEICNDVYVSSINSKKKELDTFFEEFVKKFMEKHKEEKQKIPYQINLIDELHANENAHSRILTKLLQEQDEKGYSILNSFLKYLGAPFSKLTEEKVILITQETDRIDLRVRWKKTSLIIENKINYAPEQEKQIERYIENEKALYQIENIYVLYLGRNGSEEPSEYSFPLEIRNKIGERYRPIGFKNTILPWLKNEVYPNCKLKEKFLESAVIQYIDYLNGMFNLRENQKNMEKELEKFISEKLELIQNSKNVGELEENYKKLQEKSDNISEIQNVISNMINESKFQLMLQKIRTGFPDFKPYIDKPNDQLGLELKYKDIGFISLINIHDAPYYSCRKLRKDGEEYANKKDDLVDKKLKELFSLDKELIELDKDNEDYYYNSFNFEDVYDVFEKNTKKIIKAMEIRSSSSSIGKPFTDPS